ncbi:MAG: lysostaphin resistance A-like protein [Candidatus Rokuibacteriota bacterium]
MDPLPRPWQVLLAYLLAFAMIVCTSLLAAGVVIAMYPDEPERVVLQGLPGLLAGGIASSAALALTLLLVVRPLEPSRLRLLPGRETGPALVVMVVGVLSLGQSLDSLTTLVGLDDRGAMPEIRRALSQAVGPDLFAAVVVIGLLAGTAEELFFRGYMQTALRQRWRPLPAVALTSLCFGLLHLEWIHAALAFVLGLYLGFLVELTGSALPAVVCHVVNNGLFTLLTALAGTVEGTTPNLALAIGGPVVFVGCVLWLRRTFAPAPG